MKKTGLNQKGQLTFFILMGFLIIIIMAIVFYVTKNQASHKTEAQAGLSQQTTLDIVNIKTYVTDCLRKTANDGMKLLGEQGGIIYPDQKGVPFPEIDYSVIPEPQRSILIAYAAGFPNIIEDYASLTEADNRDVRVFYGLKFDEDYLCTMGEITLNCKKDGSVLEGNFSGGVYPWIDGTIPFNPAAVFFFPQPFDPDYPTNKLRACSDDQEGCFGKRVLQDLDNGNLSMYNQLKVYINNTIESCLDFSAFPGFKIEKNGTFSVDVKTTDQTVIAELKYPLTIVDTTSRKMNRIDTFYYDTKIRLKKLHNISLNIIKYDQQDESFNINEQFQQPSIGGDTSMSLIIKHDGGTTILNPPRDNIVSITDTYAGNKFVFQFARRNRPPVLDFIDSSPIQIQSDTNINESWFNSTYHVDPDESNATMYYFLKDYSIGEVSNIPVQSFSFNVTSIFCPPGASDNIFELSVCVSDGLYPTPCYHPGISIVSASEYDLSSDWQDIKFNLTDC